jgi:uncharacterized protein YqgC (DUF456 family)
VAGSIFPVIPGPPLAFLALILLSIAREWEPFSLLFLAVMAILMILLIITDYILPAAYAKKYGASKLGVLGAVLGMIVGIFFFPPFGMLIGALAGALIGELLSGSKAREALRAGWGIFVGNLFASALKLVYTCTCLFFYIKELFQI